jgi:CheY-like chemotaxis protein
MKILVIDDDELICRSLLRGLRKHEATAEHDAGRAIERAVHEPFDVILCDLGMPGQDGLAILATLRARMPVVPVFVIMSGQPLADPPPAPELPDLLLLKPFSAAELEEQLARLVALRAGP